MIRVAIVDSGVHADHPHVNGIAGGAGIVTEDYIDRIGHGTAIAAAIREKAPDTELYAVKVFDRTLSTQVESLVKAIRWANQHRMDLVNLSLGTSNAAHADVLAAALDPRTIVIAASGWLPGDLPDAIPVILDWTVPRDEYRSEILPDGRIGFRASGYPRPIPGVDPERNLKGISFAVANMTGFAARVLQYQHSASHAPTSSFSASHLAALLRSGAAH